MLASGGKSGWPPGAPLGSQKTPGVKAISVVLSELLARLQPHGDRNTTALVIPNSLDESFQQQLLDAFRRQGIEAKLVWRPVAAALSWCERYKTELAEMAPGEGKVLGHIFALYLGLDALEFDRLDVVARRYEDEWHFLPARRRPEFKPLHCFGLKLGSALVDAFVQAEDLGAKQVETWHVLWCTTLLRDSLTFLAGDHDVTPASSGSYFGSADGFGRLTAKWDRALRNWGQSGPERLPDFGAAVPEPPHVNDLTKWLGDTRGLAKGAKGRLLGAVIGGPFAPVRNGESTLGETLLDKVGLPRERVLTERESCRSGVLSEGAAIYAYRIEHGLPTYLDTLPRIYTVVTKYGEPIWHDLLKEDDEYVEGGRTWKRDPNLEGLSIASGTDSLTIALNHKEHPTVREVSASLPRELDQRTPISLAVSMEPANGNARIEVVPDEADTFRRRSVYVEWDSMEETGKSPDSWLDGIDRTCPAVSPRTSSHRRRGPALDAMKSFLRSHDRAGLARATTALQQKDQAAYPRDATAVSSDGEIPLGKDELAQFVSLLVGELQAGRRSRLDEDEIVRALGYTSTDREEFRDYLMSQLTRYGTDLGTNQLNACGQCLRRPEDILLFSNRLAARLRYPGSNNWVKAFSQMLRFREHAARDIPSRRCEALTGHFLDLFKEQCRGRRGSHIFRNCSLGIVFLLRRRKYDDSYLDPKADLAVRVKAAFEAARTNAMEGKLSLMGGSVDLPVVLKTMIDYIDRRGRGIIMMDEG